MTTSEPGGHQKREAARKRSFCNVSARIQRKRSGVRWTTKVESDSCKKKNWWPARTCLLLSSQRLLGFWHCECCDKNCQLSAAHSFAPIPKERKAHRLDHMNLVHLHLDSDPLFSYLKCTCVTLILLYHKSILQCEALETGGQGLNPLNMETK
jgi:hypothetical protein